MRIDRSRVFRRAWQIHKQNGFTGRLSGSSLRESWRIEKDLITNAAEPAINGIIEDIPKIELHKGVDKTEPIFGQGWGGTHIQFVG